MSRSHEQLQRHRRPAQRQHDRRPGDFEPHEGDSREGRRGRRRDRRGTPSATRGHQLGAGARRLPCWRSSRTAELIFELGTVLDEAEHRCVDGAHGLHGPADPAAAGTLEVDHEHDASGTAREHRRVRDGQHGRAVEQHDVGVLEQAGHERAHARPRHHLRRIRQRPAGGDHGEPAAAALRGLRQRDVQPTSAAGSEPTSTSPSPGESGTPKARAGRGGAGRRRPRRRRSHRGPAPARGRPPWSTSPCRPPGS